MTEEDETRFDQGLVIEILDTFLKIVCEEITKTIRDYKMKCYIKKENKNAPSFRLQTK